METNQEIIPNKVRGMLSRNNVTYTELTKAGERTCVVMFNNDWTPTKRFLMAIKDRKVPHRLVDFLGVIAVVLPLRVDEIREEALKVAARPYEAITKMGRFTDKDTLSAKFVPIEKEVRTSAVTFIQVRDCDTSIPVADLPFNRKTAKDALADIKAKEAKMHQILVPQWLKRHGDVLTNIVRYSIPPHIYVAKFGKALQVLEEITK